MAVFRCENLCRISTWEASLKALERPVSGARFSTGRWAFSGRLLVEKVGFAIRQEVREATQSPCRILCRDLCRIRYRIVYRVACQGCGRSGELGLGFWCEETPGHTCSGGSPVRRFLAAGARRAMGLIGRKLAAGKGPVPPRGERRSMA